MHKVWFITGTAPGLGRLFAEAVLANGDCLFATARRTEAMAYLADRYGERVSTYALDVADAGAAASAMEQAVKTFGRLDVLVNNAGYGTIGSIKAPASRRSSTDRRESLRDD